VWATKFHTHTKQRAKWYFCIWYSVHNFLAWFVYLDQFSFIICLFIRRVQRHDHKVCVYVQWCCNRSDGGPVGPAADGSQLKCLILVELHSISIGKRGIAVQLRSTQTSLVAIMRKLPMTTETIQRLSAVGCRRLPHCKWWPGGGACWRADTAPLTVNNQTFCATTLSGSRFTSMLNGEN